MEPFDAYRYYNALKLHFEGKYDAVKYRFKTSANHRSFWKRKDKYFFAKVAKKFNSEEGIVNYYVSHFINGSAWVGDMIKDEKVYDEWLKRTESLSYNIEQDLYKLEASYDSFDRLFLSEDGQYPPIINELLSEEIMLETVVVLDQMLGFVKKADKKVTDTIVWPDIKLKIEKYKPFLKADQNKVKKIILKVFTS